MRQYVDFSLIFFLILKFKLHAAREYNQNFSTIIRPAYMHLNKLLPYTTTNKVKHFYRSPEKTLKNVVCVPN